MAENLRTSASIYTILVVDDEELIRNLVVTFLSGLGHSCFTAVDGVDALNKMKQNRIDAVITDIKMPNMDGIMLTSEISKRYPECPIMVMTGFDEVYSAGTAIAFGAAEFIRKPFSLDEFAIRLHKMISDSEALRPLKTGKNGGDDMQDLMGELEGVLKKS
ncbi:MAG: response regulator [Thermodesulfobacteriota bacterium]